MRDQGRLVKWFDDQKSGLIQPYDQTKSLVRLDLKDFAKKGPQPIVGCALEYQIEVNKKGEYQAKHVLYLTAKQYEYTTQKEKDSFSDYRESTHLTASTVMVLIYWVILFVLNSMNKLPHIWISIFFIAHIVIYFLCKPFIEQKKKIPLIRCFFIYAFSCLGGWPIIFLMQNKLGFNTQSQPFKALYIGTIALNIICTFLIISATYSF